MQSKEFKSNIKIIFPALIILLFLVLAFFGKYIVSKDPYEMNSSLMLAKPSLSNYFGCDHLGRDLFTRIIIGMESSLLLSIAVASITFFIGVSLGIIAGLFEGVIGTTIMRVVDMMLAFPGVVLSIAIVGILGPGILNTMIALIIPGWAEFARISRAITITEKSKEYITTSLLNGLNNFQIAVHHILPNIIPKLLVFFTLSISSFILKFAGLSFLGLGFKPPRPELGLILSEAKDYMQTAPAYMIFPGLALLLIVIIFNIFGELLREKMRVERVDERVVND